MHFENSQTYRWPPDQAEEWRWATNVEASGNGGILDSAGRCHTFSK